MSDLADSSRPGSRGFVLALVLTIGALVAAAPWFFNRSSILALPDCTAATLQAIGDPGLRAYARAYQDDQVRTMALQKAGQWTASHGFADCRERICGALLDDGAGGVRVEVRPLDLLSGPPLARLALDVDDLDVDEAETTVDGCSAIERSAP